MYLNTCLNINEEVKVRLYKHGKEQHSAVGGHKVFVFFMVKILF